MNKSLITAGLLALAASGTSHAVNVTSITGTGTYGNDPAALLTDGDFGLGSWWTDAPNVHWTGQTGPTGVVLTFTFDQTYILSDATFGVDNNDYYVVQVSKDNVAWNTLLLSLPTTIDGDYLYDGESMIKRTSIASELGYSPLVDFAPVQARYARIYALTGDDSYAVSEVQFSGIPAVPEPETWALLVTGLGGVGLSVTRRRKKG